MKRIEAIKSLGAIAGLLVLSGSIAPEYPFIYDVKIPHSGDLEDPMEYKLVMESSIVGNGGIFDETQAYMVTQSIDKVHYEPDETLHPEVIRHRLKYWVNVKVYSKIDLKGHTLSYCSEYGQGLKRVAYKGFIWNKENAYWKNHTSEIIT